MESKNTVVAESVEMHGQHLSGLSTRINPNEATDQLLEESCVHSNVRRSDGQTAVKNHKKLKRILVGTDFSRPAANAVLRAAMLAAEHSAELEIVHVPSTSDCPNAHALREQRLNQITQLVGRYHSNANLRIVHGRPATTLALEAERFGADLVVVGCRRKRSLKDTLIGTTAERFLKRWTGNTLVVRNSPTSPYKAVLACMSLAPESCAVVNSAVALSTVANLSVLHVYQPPFEKLLFSQHAGSKVIKNNRAIARRELALRTAALLQQCALPYGREVKIILKHGHPSTIPGTAARRRADVIVVGRSRSVIDKLIFGSVTKNVLRSASSDVLISRSS